jgi:hypothetical protein
MVNSNLLRVRTALAPRFVASECDVTHLIATERR